MKKIFLILIIVITTFVVINKNSNRKDENIIKNNLDDIEQIVKNDTKNESYDYNINYGYNYFPEKEYNGKKFNEGNYESLLITLGEAKGDNWWCILFPPLCLIEAEDKNTEEVEYSFFIEELFDTIFHKK